MNETLLLANCMLIATMDDDRREIERGSILIRGNAIEAVGPAETLEAIGNSSGVKRFCRQVMCTFSDI